MNLTYNNYIENNFPDYLRGLLTKSFSDLGFSPISIDCSFEDHEITHFINNRLTCNYKFTISYLNNLGVEGIVSIYVPRLVNMSFVIGGSIKIPTYTMKNDNTIRAYKDTFYFDSERNIDYSSRTFRYRDESTGEWVLVPIHEVDLTPIPDSILVFNEYSNTKLCIKLGLETKSLKITTDLLNDIVMQFEGNPDLFEDFILDKRIVSCQNSLVMHINKNKGKITKMVNSKGRQYGRFYPTDIQKIIDAFFKMRSDSFISIQTPTKVNSLNFYSVSSKLIINTSGSNMAIYNESFSDLIDPARTPENSNVNRINEFNSCAVVMDDGTMGIKIYDKDFNPITLPYHTYYDSKIVSNQSVDYVMRSIHDEVEYKYRGSTFKVMKSDLESISHYYIDAKADDKISVSTKNIPMINHTDSVRTGMGAQMVNQAVELVNAQPPIVTSGSFSDNDNPINVVSNKAGTVELVSNGFIRVRNTDGTISEYVTSPVSSINNININRLPTVKVGDSIEADTIIAKSKVVDNGYNLGVNVRVALLGYGATFEDGVIVSEDVVDLFAHVSVEDVLVPITAVDKLGSITALGSKVGFGDVLVDKESLLIKPRLLDKILDGDAKYSGTSYHVPSLIAEAYVSDVVILKGKLVATPEEDKIVNDYLSRPRPEITDPLVQDYVDYRLDESSPYDEEGYKYLIKIKMLSLNRLKQGNKLTNRFGSKGLTAKILPKDLMPMDENGEHIQVILNPFTTIARKNMSQLLELNLSGISKKLWDKIDTLIHDPKNEDSVRTRLSRIVNDNLRAYSYEELLNYHIKSDGQYQIITGNFSSNLPEKVQEELKDLGIPIEGEYLYDGFTKRKMLNPVITGYMYMMKLYHLPEYKNKVSSAFRQGDHPVLGGKFRDDGLKIGEMELHALYSSNMDEFVEYIRSDGELLEKNLVLSDLLLIGYDYDHGTEKETPSGIKLDRFKKRFNPKQ